MKPEIKISVDQVTGHTGFLVRAWIADTHSGVQMFVERSQLNRAKKLLTRQLLAQYEATQKKVELMKKNASHKS